VGLVGGIFGVVGTVLGLFGLAPLLVIGVDRLLARPVARLFGVEPSLLRQQLAGGLWRSVGTVSALMVGVVALVGMQTHGRSMIEGWRLPDEFPDMLLFSPFGLESEAIEKLVEGYESGAKKQTLQR